MLEAEFKDGSIRPLDGIKTYNIELQELGSNSIIGTIYVCLGTYTGSTTVCW